jgi:ubiquinone/menaquinone biosynthesis C-methylase UbiE
MSNEQAGRQPYIIVPNPEGGWADMVQHRGDQTYRMLGGGLYGVDEPSPKEVQELYEYWQTEHPISYDSKHAWIEQIGQNSGQIIAANRPKAAERVLDIACGSGMVVDGLRKVLSPTTTYTGIDLTRGMLHTAQQKQRYAQLIQADVRAMPFKEDSFDAVVGSLFINHLPVPKDRLNVFEHVRSCLRSNGVFVLVDTQNNPATHEIAGELKETFDGSHSLESLAHHNPTAPGGFEMDYHIVTA